MTSPMALYPASFGCRWPPESNAGLIVGDGGSLLVDTLWDERLSSAAVNRFLVQDVDLSRKKRQAAVDRSAAAWLLQGALDAAGELQK